MTREDIIAGLKAGRTLVCDRRDAPALPIALALCAEGLAVQEFVQYDEQSSALKFRASDALKNAQQATGEQHHA